MHEANLLFWNKVDDLWCFWPCKCMRKLVKLNNMQYMSRKVQLRSRGSRCCPIKLRPNCLKWFVYLKWVKKYCCITFNIEWLNMSVLLYGTYKESGRVVTYIFFCILWFTIKLIPSTLIAPEFTKTFNLICYLFNNNILEKIWVVLVICIFFYNFVIFCIIGSSCVPKFLIDIFWKNVFKCMMFLSNMS